MAFKVRKRGETTKKIRNIHRNVKESQFFLSFLSAFNPKKYLDFSQRPARKVTTYFLSLVFITLIISIILALPQLVALDSYIQKKLGSFNTLEIDVKQEMNSPILIPDKNPKLVIDTSTNNTDYRRPVLIINDDDVVWKSITTKETPAREYKDIVKSKVEVSSWLVILIIFLLPSIIFFGYLIFAMKYITIIFIASLMIYLLTKLTKKKVPYSAILKIGIYASTLLLVVDVIGRALFESIFFIQYITFIIFYLLGLQMATKHIHTRVF